MEASLCHLTIPALSYRSSVVLPQIRPPSVLCLPLSTTGTSCRRVAGALRCVSWGGLGSVAEVDRELEAEVSPEEGQEWLKLGTLKEKCGGGKGVVELLECLEREAIMGEDQGRDPTDYNRRAKIFSTSSRVFQALKQRNEAAPAPPHRS